MGLIEGLRSNRPIPTLPHEAADALERLAEYATHDALCERRQHTANVLIQDCTCGLSALLKEIGEC